MRSRFRILLLFLAVPTFGHTTITVNPGGGADQTSLSAAEAALPDPLTDDYIISCAGATDDTITTGVTINAVTLNGATQYTLEIIGDNTSGLFDANKYTLKVGNSNITALTLSNNYLTVRNLQVVGGNSASYNYSGISIGGATANVTVRNCIVKDFIRPTTNAGIEFASGTGTGHLVYNNVVTNCEVGIRFSQNGQGEADNNTVTSCVLYGLYVYRTNSRTLTAQNNLMKGNGTGDDYHQLGSGGTLTTATNYTADANSPDTGCANATITFVGAADFHLDAAMSGTLLGTNLSGTFTLDIDAETRSSWYAGVDELPPTTKATLLIQLLSR